MTPCSGISFSGMSTTPGASAAPLRQAEDALLVDTTGNSLDESLDVLLETIKRRLKA